MIILSANNLRKEYGTDVILEDISFHINERDRVGLIGVNGAGKTTLFKILTGELPHEGGEFYVSNQTTIGYLKQNDAFDSENTVFGEIDGIFAFLHEMEDEIARISQQVADLSASGASQAEVDAMLHRLDALQQEYDMKGGYSYKSEITGVLSSMAFGPEFYDKKISTLSGGERTRLALAALLLKKPDLLFLDEPTNHLDIGTLKWLEGYLKTYKGTIVVVSHDRYFLDRTVTRIFEVENKRLCCYEGNYSEFAEKKRLRREEDLRHYENQAAEIRRQEDMIRRYKERGTEHLAKRAASREKRLAHVERLERPDAEPGKMKIRFKQNFQSGNDVLIGEGLAKGFGYGRERRELFKNVNFDIKRGERICIVGANGIGKTTLLKILIGELAPDSGYLKVGHNVDFGYYDQGQLLLNGSNTVLDELKESYRLYTDTEMRSILGRFLFRGEDVFLTISSLSGGEKARLSLAKMMLAGSNTLILDEPTNHLDINSKEVFEEALREFPGTVIVVSHDRYFLSRIPDRIIELTPEGAVNYLGKYDYYLEKKQQEIESGKKYMEELGKQTAAASEPEGSGLSSAEERRLKKEAATAAKRLEKEKARLEERIAELEADIEDLQSKMCMPQYFSDHAKLGELNSLIEDKKAELSKVYDSWMELEDSK
jgi:ATP-binding cassette subfamily F protein 3